MLIWRATALFELVLVFIYRPYFVSAAGKHIRFLETLGYFLSLTYTFTDGDRRLPCDYHNQKLLSHWRYLLSRQGYECLAFSHICTPQLLRRNIIFKLSHFIAVFSFRHTSLLYLPLVSCHTYKRHTLMPARSSFNRADAFSRSDFLKMLERVYRISAI